MHDAKAALKALGQRIGLPQLSFNGDGLCELTVGKDLEIFFEGSENATVLQINGHVGDLLDAGETGLKGLLKANFGGQGTGAAALAIDPVSEEIVLTRQLDIARLSEEDFVLQVEDFVRYVEFWTDYWPTMAGDTVTSQAPAGDEFMLRL